MLLAALRDMQWRRRRFVIAILSTSIIFAMTLVLTGLALSDSKGGLLQSAFIVTYALVSIALPRYLRIHGVCRPGSRIIPWMACFAMLLALAGNLYPVPEGPYGRLPYIYLAYLAAGLLWFFWNTRKAALIESRNGSSASAAHREAE